MIDIISPNQEYSVAEFKAEAEDNLKKIYDK
jgi:tRNA A37 N6-isopentenylltransferase MiaA